MNKILTMLCDIDISFAKIISLTMTNFQGTTVHVVPEPSSLKAYVSKGYHAGLNGIKRNGNSIIRFVDLRHSPITPDPIPIANSSLYPRTKGCIFGAKLSMRIGARKKAICRDTLKDGRHQLLFAAAKNSTVLNDRGPSTLLEAGPEILERYKLETTFNGDYVSHTLNELPECASKVTRWRRVKQIGSGGFAVVWLEQNLTTGQTRAVKQLMHGRCNFSRELQMLIELSDVSTACTP